MHTSDERDVVVLRQLAELRTAGQERVTLEEIADGRIGRANGASGR